MALILRVWGLRAEGRAHTGLTSVPSAFQVKAPPFPLPTKLALAMDRRNRQTEIAALYSSHPFPLPPAPWQTIKRLGGSARLCTRAMAFELQAGGAISPPWLRAFHLHRADPFISLILKRWKRKLFVGVCWVDDFPKPVRFVWVSKLALIQQAEMAILSAPNSEQRQSSDVKSFSKPNSSLAFLFLSKFLVWFALQYSLQVFAVRPVYYHTLHHIRPCPP